MTAPVRLRPPPHAADVVVARLEEAGMTLLALPNAKGKPAGARCGWPEVVHDFREAYGWSASEMRPPVPSAASISRMDEALAWLGLIHQDRYVIRRIVGCRMLVNPHTQKHMLSWRRIAVTIGADHRAVQRWHAQGIADIVTALADGGEEKWAAPEKAA